MQAIQRAIDLVELGQPQVFENLAVFAVLGKGGVTSDYQVLDDALAGETARVTEVSESGSVPELRFENDAPTPVLLLDGEELVGAKQNRILNLSILAPGQAAITIPVSCVEAGRWAWRSNRFGVSGRTQYASARSMKMGDVSASLRDSGFARSNQRAVWNDISAKMARMESRSRSEAMADLFEQYEQRVKRYVAAITPEAGQIGAVFALNGEVRGVELFDCPETFSRQLGKLLRSWALDGIDEGEKGADVPVAAEAEAMLREVGALPAEAYPAAGLGEDVRLEGARTTGGALVVEDRVVHLCAFRRARHDEVAEA